MTERIPEMAVPPSGEPAVKRKPLTAFSAGAVIGILGGLIGLGGCGVSAAGADLLIFSVS